MQPIKVLIVDDSMLMRNILSALLERDNEIEVVGCAIDPFDAREKIKQLNPDVLTLDVEMPGMNGLEFLRNLMRLRPMPVVMVSTLTLKGAPVTLKALELGAFDFIAKPEVNSEAALSLFSEQLRARVKMASTANVTVARVASTKQPSLLFNQGNIQNDLLIAIGASTGGTEALRQLLTPLSPPFPPIVITQHIPEHFSRAFAQRLNSNCALTVIESAGGEVIEQNHVYIAPGGKHLQVKRSHGDFICHLVDSEPVNRHKPSVDVLFDSVVDTFGEHAIGIMLTGMGKDGAEGLAKLRSLGAFTIAQDEATSVVWGMPGAAVKIGAVEQVLALTDIAPKLVNLVQKTTPMVMHS